MTGSKLGTKTSPAAPHRVARLALGTTILAGIALSGSGCIGMGGPWFGGSSSGGHTRSTPVCDESLTGSALLSAIDRGDCRYLPDTP